MEGVLGFRTAVGEDKKVNPKMSPKIWQSNEQLQMGSPEGAQRSMVCVYSYSNKKQKQALSPKQYFLSKLIDISGKTALLATRSSDTVFG